MNTKQVIVMRKDLKMRRGKEIAQGSHASMAFITRRLRPRRFLVRLLERLLIWLLSRISNKFVVDLKPVEQYWLSASYAKVCLQVNSEEELLTIEAKAKEAGIECHVIVDSGRTEFNGVPTKTCLALGPDESEKIDRITGSLTLY